MSEYPEHDKMAAVKDRSRAIGEFIEWLWSEEYHIAKYAKLVDGLYDEWLMPAGRSINEWLADYFDIDLNRIEEEKRDMLDKIRAANA